MLKRKLIGFTMSFFLIVSSVINPGLYILNPVQKETPKAKTIKKADPIASQADPSTNIKNENATVKTQTTPSNKTTTANYRQNAPDNSGGTKLSSDQYQMLARIIHAEAGGEPFTGQVAVGAVILNRIRSGIFPSNVTANVLKAGEFESVSNGYIWRNNPSASSYRAAQLALKGWDPTAGATYFYNPAGSSSRWIWTRPITIIIGKHNFAV